MTNEDVSKKRRKADLIIALQDLLQKNTVGTHEEIREALQKEGFIVNQVKISRILHKLGAIKMTEGDRIVYRLPSELMSITPKDSLRQLILTIKYNEVLIVLQTAPGSAQLVARLLDQKDDNDILGTIAGDDTVFIAPQSTKNIKIIFQKINKLLLG